MRIHPRISFGWFELVLTSFNIISSATIPLICSGQVFAQVFYAISCLNGFRIIRRFDIFKSHLRAFMRSCLFMLKISLILIFLLLVMTTLAFSILKLMVNGCSLASYLEPISAQVISIYEKCLANGGTISHYLVNYDSFGDSLLSQYLMIDRCEWHRVLDNFVQTWTGSSFYIAVMVMMALLVPGFINIVLKATTTGICYTVLGQQSLVNTDSSANLSPPHIEYVHIQEELCKTKLLRKPTRISHRWSLWCQKVRSSLLWKVSFYLIIFAAFGLNLSP